MSRTMGRAVVAGAAVLVGAAVASAFIVGSAAAIGVGHDGGSVDTALTLTRAVVAQSSGGGDDRGLPASTSPLPSSQAEALRQAEQLLKSLVAEHKIAGAVAAVAQRGQVLAFHVAGVQSLESGAPMEARSLFRIYSMTKPVTAVAVMKLVEEGRLHLADPVSQFLPAFAHVRVQGQSGTLRAASRAITIEDLLLHTSGLNHRTSPEYRAAGVRARSITLPTFVDNVVRVPLMEDPGTRYRYSESTTVLGRVIEVLSGMPFDEFLEQRIFAPLKMNDTSFVATADRVRRLTTVYAPADGGGIRPVEIEDVPFTVRPALLEGAVGLLSTAPDYLRFAQMLLNRGALDGVRVLRAETVDQMVRNGLSPAVQSDRGGPMGWGLANVNVVLDPSRVPYPSVAGEYGWDGTAGTIFWVDPSREVITVLMTQSAPANPDRIRQRYKTIVEQALATGR